MVALCRMQESCPYGGTLYINNCGNTDHQCNLDDGCCCTGSLFVTDGGCNLCCPSGQTGCEFQSAQGTMEYGCYDGEGAGVLIAADPVIRCHH